MEQFASKSSTYCTYINSSKTSEEKYLKTCELFDFIFSAGNVGHLHNNDKLLNSVYDTLKRFSISTYEFEKKMADIYLPMMDIVIKEHVKYHIK